MNVWDNLSSKYDNLWVQKYSLTPSRKKVIDLIGKKKIDFSLLDVGCATGQLLCEIKENCPTATLFGVDKSNSMIKIAKSKSEGITFECVAVEDLKTDNRFDIITCCHSFPYYPNKSEILRTLSTLIKEDGIAIFIQASINSQYDKFVMSIIEKTAEKAEYLSKKDFCYLASKHFTIKDSFTIKEKWFMPNICGFVLGKKL